MLECMLEVDKNMGNRLEGMLLTKSKIQEMQTKLEQVKECQSNLKIYQSELATDVEKLDSNTIEPFISGVNEYVLEDFGYALESCIQSGESLYNELDPKGNFVINIQYIWNWVDSQKKGSTGIKDMASKIRSRINKLVADRRHIEKRSDGPQCFTTDTVLCYDCEGNGVFIKDMKIGTNYNYNGKLVTYHGLMIKEKGDFIVYGKSDVWATENHFDKVDLKKQESKKCHEILFPIIKGLPDKIPVGSVNMYYIGLRNRIKRFLSQKAIDWYDIQYERAYINFAAVCMI